MNKFRKKPVVVEATQWFKMGDHLKVRQLSPATFFGKPCSVCRKDASEHGYIDTLEGGHIVCPGDWIITGVKGERYPCKPDIFEATYEPAEEKG